MNHRRVVIDSLPQAYKVIKEMNLDTDDADYRRHISGRLWPDIASHALRAQNSNRFIFLHSITLLRSECVFCPCVSEVTILQ